MKKIFISIPWFLPAYKAGGPVQSIANLVSQHGLGCHFYIFCGDADLNGEKLAGILKDQWVSFNECTDVYYASGKNRAAILQRETENLQPDRIFVIGLYDRDFNIASFMLGKYDQTIISARGMLHPGALSQKVLKKKLFLAWFRLKGFHKKCLFHATDEQEAMHIKKALGKNARVMVAGNFPRLFHTVSVPVKKSGSVKLLCLALISPMKNHLLVLQALAGMREDVEYHIAGPVKDQAYWNECLAAIGRLPSNISVKVHGEITPGEVGKWLSAGHVFIMPSKSENFGHSLVEAMSAGLPVITSRFTPWNGLEEKQAGRNVDLDMASIRHAVTSFAVMDADAYAGWRAGASAYAAAAFDLAKLKDQYRELFGLTA